jgi:hypothetical protein
MALPVNRHETGVLARELGVWLTVEPLPGNVLTEPSTDALHDALAGATADPRADTVVELLAHEAQHQRRLRRTERQRPVA